MTIINFQKTSEPEIYTIKITNTFAVFTGEVSKYSFPDSMNANFVDITRIAIDNFNKKHKDVINSEPSIISYIKNMNDTNEYYWYIEIKIDSLIYQLDEKYFIPLTCNFKTGTEISNEYEKRISELELHYKKRIYDFEKYIAETEAVYKKEISELQKINNHHMMEFHNFECDLFDDNELVKKNKELTQKFDNLTAAYFKKCDEFDKHKGSSIERYDELSIKYDNLTKNHDDLCEKYDDLYDKYEESKEIMMNLVKILSEDCQPIIDMVKKHMDEF